MCERKTLSSFSPARGGEGVGIKPGFIFFFGHGARDFTRWVPQIKLAQTWTTVDGRVGNPPVVAVRDARGARRKTEGALMGYLSLARTTQTFP